MTITVRTPDELYTRMKIHNEINWGVVIRNAIRAGQERVENVSTGVKIVEKLKRMRTGESCSRKIALR